MRIQRQVNAQKAFREGFTLLEIMVGVGVLGMLLVTMYQLVGTQLMALKNSRDSQLESVAMEGLVRYVQGILANLPLKTNVIEGRHNIYGVATADELQWISRPGMALLTSAAPDDEYTLTIMLLPTTATSKQQDMGIRRRLSSEPDNSYEWIPLLSNVAGLEFTYFHPSLGQWVPDWRDPTTTPPLVRMRVWRNADDDPFEVVLPVPSARINNK